MMMRYRGEKKSTPNNTSSTSTPLIADKSSWTSTLANTFSKINPFNYSSNYVSNTLSVIRLATLSMLPTVVNAEYCFRFPGSRYSLDCSPESIGEKLMDLLIKQCQPLACARYTEAFSNIGASMFEHSMGMGDGYFAGHHCTVQYDGSFAPCVKQTLEQNVPNGEFGTPQDILATVGIVVGTAGALAASITLGVCLFKHKIKKCIREREDLAELDAMIGTEEHSKQNTILAQSA